MQQIQITRPTHPDWSPERLELHETSFHEAGHAVLAALAGTYDLGEIDARTGDRFGHFDCVFHERLHSERDTSLGRPVNPDSELAVILGGGAAAQRAFLQLQGIGLGDDGNISPETEKYLMLCAHGDLVMVKEMSPPANFRKAISDAHQHFQAPGVWATVYRLANQVIQRNGLMTKQEVRQFLEQEVRGRIGVKQLV